MFKGKKTFAIRNDSIKRCDVHSKNKFVLTKEIKVAKYLKSVLAVFDI